MKRWKNFLAESEHYAIYNEYENVILEVRESHRQIQIGDFYGEPQMAVISRDEKFCVMCGCGVIIYYLREPFMEYEYNTQTGQWREWGRNGTEAWVERVDCINDEMVELLTEDGKRITISAYD